MAFKNKIYDYEEGTSSGIARGTDNVDKGLEAGAAANQHVAQVLAYKVPYKTAIKIEELRMPNSWLLVVLLGVVGYEVDCAFFLVFYYCLNYCFMKNL